MSTEVIGKSSSARPTPIRFRLSSQIALSIHSLCKTLYLKTTVLLQHDQKAQKYSHLVTVSSLHTSPKDLPIQSVFNDRPVDTGVSIDPFKSIDTSS